MKQTLIECIPNFSEGRDQSVVEAIVNSIKSVSGVVVLNYSSDPDHNRSVVTFVGEPQPVVEASYQAIQVAARLINMDVQRGTHPRLGATDVVPFVPLSGATMDECVILARQLGKRVGDELDIPVYLYQEAALRSHRKNLEDVRRGQYEALKDDIGRNPDRTPDFGPSVLGTAGATIIGARYPLVAFNVYLTTNDVQIARKIARQIRFSSGGFPHVKALGMLVNGYAQVSINFTNTAVSPLFPVIEAIRHLAESDGIGIHHSELIGLVSNSVLVDVASAYLQLQDFSVEQILEHKLSMTYLAESTFLE